MPAPEFDPTWVFEIRASYLTEAGASVLHHYVTIPGFGGGPDGPKEPNDPAQERWMRAHSGLQEVWYLTWEFDCTPDEMRARIERWRSGP